MYMVPSVPVLSQRFLSYHLYACLTPIYLPAFSLATCLSFLYLYLYLYLYSV